MGTVKCDNFTDAAGTGPDNHPHGMTLETSGGDEATNLNYYEEYTYSITTGDLGVNTGGGTFSAISGTLRITRVGKVVTITIDQLTFTTASSVNGVILLSGALIPERFLPAVSQELGLFSIGIGGTGIFWKFIVNASTNQIVLSTRADTGNNTAIADATYTLDFSGSYTL